MTNKIFMYHEGYAREHKVGALPPKKAMLKVLQLAGIILLLVVAHIIISVFLMNSILGILWFAYGFLAVLILPCVGFALWLAVRSETQRTAYIVKDSSLYLVKLIGTESQVLATQGNQERYIDILERALMGQGTWAKEWYQWIYNKEAEIRRLDDLKILRSKGKYTFVSYTGYQGKKKYWLIADAFPGLRDELHVNEGYYAKHATNFPDMQTPYERHYVTSIVVVVCILACHVLVVQPLLDSYKLKKEASSINVLEAVPEELLEEICDDNYEYFQYDRSTVQIDRESGAFVYYIFGEYELDGNYYALVATKDNDSNTARIYNRSQTCEGWAYYVRAVARPQEE